LTLHSFLEYVPAGAKFVNNVLLSKKLNINKLF